LQDKLFFAYRKANKNIFPCLVDFDHRALAERFMYDNRSDIDR
jgi:hypothetical protein